MNDKEEKENKGEANFFQKNKYTLILLLFLIVTIAGTIIYSKTAKNIKKEYNYNNFILDLQNKKIQKVIMQSNSKAIEVIVKSSKRIEEENKYNEELKKAEIEKLERPKALEPIKDKKINELSVTERKEINDRTYKVTLPSIDVFTEYIQKQIDAGNDVKFEIVSPPILMKIISILFDLLPTLLLLALILITIKMQGFGSKAKVYDEKENENTGVKFKDIAGLDEEKQELMEIVDFLKNPDKYQKMGARIPKGILLYGKPGTGKTLIAKAIAGEAGVPFISMSGSEFVEMFAGLGASRVRKLFEKATKISPCIIFIDELDAIGSQRSNSIGGGDSENNQTLNQLLVEMDGFNSDERVIVIAATNRPELLDKALLRPGRFDRQITVAPPDVNGREEILKLNAKGKKIKADVNFKEIASDTAGFTGAELSNIMNEAAILATRNRKDEISQEDIEEAIKKVMVGLEKQNRVISEKDKKITAYHEAGHAIVSHFLETQEDVKEISIIPRGMAGGYTMYKTTEDKSYISKQELLENMVSLMGGRAAEALIIGDISTGASNDLEVATAIAKAMVITYGMNEKVGPININVNDPNEINYFGENITKQIGEEIKKYIDDAYLKAKNILQKEEKYLHIIANILLKQEKMTSDEFKQIFETNEK